MCVIAAELQHRDLFVKGGARVPIAYSFAGAIVMVTDQMERWLVAQKHWDGCQFESSNNSPRSTTGYCLLTFAWLIVQWLTLDVTLTFPAQPVQYVDRQFHCHQHLTVETDESFDGPERDGQLRVKRTFRCSQNYHFGTRPWVLARAPFHCKVVSMALQGRSRNANAHSSSRQAESLEGDHPPSNLPDSLSCSSIFIRCCSSCFILEEMRSSARSALEKRQEKRLWGWWRLFSLIIHALLQRQRKRISLQRGSRLLFSLESPTPFKSGRLLDLDDDWEN